jgi:hypothetical protein
METNNNDDVMGKAAASAIENPEGMAQSLDNLKNTLQQLADKAKEVKATAGVQDTNTGVQTEGESGSPWTEEDTIDELMSKVLGYTYYDSPWNQRNRLKSSSERYNINDESGKTVKANASEEDVIEYANTVYHYDMVDNDGEEIKSFEDAKNALENEGSFKLVNVKDTKQMSLFPAEKKQEVEKPNTVISKMDDASYQRFLDGISNAFVRNRVSEVIEMLKAGDKKGAYVKLRSLVDSLKESKENLVNSETFRIIAESERPKLTKSDILEFVKQRKNTL